MVLSVLELDEIQIPYEDMGWDEHQRRVFVPPPSQTVAEWAAANRELSRLQASHSGPLSHDRAPYLVPLMNLCAMSGILELNIKKAVQVGASEAVRSAIGFWAETDPDPMLLVLPDEKKGRGIVRKRIIPLFEDTPSLFKLLSEKKHDTKTDSVLLKNGFELTLGWSGSPSSLASDPKRRIVNDEVDKFVPWSGREADPIALAKQRTKTYEDLAFCVNISTPTVPEGAISLAFDDSDIQLYFWWTCPGCKERFLPTIATLQYDFPDDLPDDKKSKIQHLKRNQNAWIECPACDCKITEDKKSEIVADGYWGNEDDTWRLYCDGTIQGEKPIGDSIGVQLPCFHCAWIKLWEIAVEFVGAQGSLKKMMVLYNQWLGEAFEIQVDRPDAKVIAKRVRKFIPAGILPEWTGVLLSAADLQKNHCYYEVRAYGHDFRSQRIDHGRIGPFDDGTDFLQVLYDRTLGRKFEFNNFRWPGLVPQHLAIDTGGTGVDDGSSGATMTQRAYAFALADDRIIPCKSESKEQRDAILHYRVSNLERGRKRGTQAARYGVQLYLVDSNWFKDLLAEQINKYIDFVEYETGEFKRGPLWGLNDVEDKRYIQQMASEKKIIGRDGRKIWKPLSVATPNHYWDVNMLLTFAAYLADVDSLAPEKQLMEYRDAHSKPAKRASQLTTPHGQKFHVGSR